MQPGFATIESVQAVAPGTVRIATKKPDPLTPARMAQMGAQILPARFARVNRADAWPCYPPVMFERAGGPCRA